MDYRDRVISAIAERDRKRICRKVILQLQKMTEEMQSGDDSPLSNIWDEVCVQVELQESVMWKTYLDTIRSLITRELDRLDIPSKQAMWLQTSNGLKWEIEEENPQHTPYSDEDIVEFVLEDLLNTASNWTNKRIARYMELHSEFD
jgi:hypothetical protein